MIHMKKIIIIIIILGCVGCKMKEVKQVKKDVDNDFIEIIPKEAQDYINNLEDNKIILSFILY